MPTTTLFTTVLFLPKIGTNNFAEILSLVTISSTFVPFRNLSISASCIRYQSMNILFDFLVFFSFIFSVYPLIFLLTFKIGTKYFSNNNSSYEKLRSDSNLSGIHSDSLGSKTKGSFLVNKIGTNW